MLSQRDGGGLFGGHAATSLVRPRLPSPAPSVHLGNLALARPVLIDTGLNQSPTVTFVQREKRMDFLTAPSKGT